MFKMVYNIARTELQMLFYSPVAWLILVIFGVQAGLLFTGQIESLVRAREMGYSIPGSTLNVFADSWGGVFIFMQDYLYFYIPLLTMSLVSKELSSGSIRLLYSSPITNVQIIVGKFFSMMIYGLFMVGILFLIVLCGWGVIKDFDLPAVLVGLLGIYLLICAYSAIGIFMSSLTSYQIVAAIGTFAVLIILSSIGGWWQEYDIIRNITYWFAMPGRSSEFIFGMICSENVLYFVIVVCLFLTLTIIRLTAVRQNVRFVVTLGRNVGTIFIACFLGYVSALPQMKVYYDATATKINTLTPASQEIVSKLEGGVTITTYINVLDPDASWYASPSFMLSDMKRFEQYQRFKPEMKLEYVYYYDTTYNPQLDKRLPDATLREKMIEVCEINQLDSNRFLSPESIREKIDLSGEGNKFVRQIVRENGEKTWLRIFSDMMRFPSEREISIAFKRMIMELPNVGIVQGHGERSYVGNKDRDYSLFANEKSFRQSLLNQGFDVETVQLDKPVADDINILVISDMREWLTSEEEANLQQYIDRGGNLFILGEPKRREIMNQLFAKFGFEMTTGVLVKKDTNLLADVILSYPTKEARDSIAYEFGTMIRYNAAMSTPSVAGLEQIEDKGYQVIPMFKTDTIGVWNELETTDFVDDTIRLNPAVGELEKVYSTVVALSRKVGDRIQKVILTGDADCISNGEFGRKAPVELTNYTLISGGFFWLSDYEAPLDVRRPALPDDDVLVGSTGTNIIWWGFVIGLPLLLAFMGVFTWVRRKGR
ncbi:MAG: Gldg family protein [Bacteroidales bacterium]|nr:Gldg family protein [Bacteroidales bacterium]